MVLPMSKEGSDSPRSRNASVAIERSSASCGFGLSASTVSPDEEEQEYFPESLPVSPIEAALIKSATSLVDDDEAQRFDQRSQEGPSPSDFGDHKPIPLDSVCASVVITDDKELENNLDDELEDRLDRVIRGEE